MSEESNQESRRGLPKGGKNLAILGVASVIVAIIACGISLAIYHNSGDIYLDRSRPGYLPEEGDGIDNSVIEDYSFNKSGKLTMADIEEYLENLNLDIEALDSYEEPFGQEVLSDKNIGISSSE